MKDAARIMLGLFLAVPVFLLWFPMTFAIAWALGMEIDSRTKLRDVLKFLDVGYLCEPPDSVPQQPDTPS